MYVFYNYVILIFLFNLIFNIMAFFCFQLLKESVSPRSEMSIWTRIWGICIGVVGTVIIDPVCAICNLADCDGREDDNNNIET